MKKLIRSSKQVIAGIFCLILVQCPVFLLVADGKGVLDGLYSTGAVLMDADSGRVLFAKNADESYAMASTTKIMTCILALELGTPEQIVTFSEYAASMPDVQMNAKAGEQYYLKDLLYSTMLESHNDSAVAVAEAIGGNVEGFARMMNQKAEAIGCINTNFVTPNGLDGENNLGEHRTTARDLALILRYCIGISSKAEEFIEITRKQMYDFGEIQGKRYVSCHNHNALLTSYEGAFTGKTGFTGKAGYCYVGAAERGEETMIIALLGAGWYPHKSYKWVDAKKLLNYGFENFAYRTLGKESWELPEIAVSEGMKDMAAVNTDACTFLYLLGKNEIAECKVEMKKQLTAPVEKDMIVGKITYELNGRTIEQFGIYTAEAVEKSTFWNRLRNQIRSIQDFVVNLVNKKQKA